MWYFVIFHGCWNCPDSVVFYFSIGTVLTVWYFVVFHGCWNWPDSVVFCCFSIGTVLTVWYLLSLGNFVFDWLLGKSGSLYSRRDNDPSFKFGLWNAKPDFTGNKAIILIDIL